MAWRVCVLAAWAGAVLGLAALDPDGNLLVWIGVPLTVAVGALVNRGWALLAPVVGTLAYFAVVYVQDPSCSSCGDDDYQSLLMIWTVIVAIPALLALGVGLGVRRYVASTRSLDVTTE